MEKVHIGTMGWSYNFWTGNFYPSGLKPSEFLTEYAKHFDTVEVDTTFYRIPGKGTFEKWKEQTPREFLFSAKFPQIITHRKMLKNCEQELEFFIQRVATLKPKLGPLLLQLAPAFGPQKAALLRDFLPKLPGEYRYAVEVNNRQLLDERFYSFLREREVALVQVVGPFMPETTQTTADFIYIRWKGDRKAVNGTAGKVKVDRRQEIRRWAEKIAELGGGATEVFGYFSKYYSGHPPTDAKQLIESLNTKS